MFIERLTFKKKDCKTFEQINYVIFLSDINITINIQKACFKKKQWLPCNWNLYYSVHIKYVIKDGKISNYH